MRIALLRPVEPSLGRVRSEDPNAPCTIDLDILIFDGLVLEPEIWTQAHWSVPLAETGETVGQAAHRFSQVAAIVPRRDVRL